MRGVVILLVSLAMPAASAAGPGASAAEPPGHGPAPRDRDTAANRRLPVEGTILSAYDARDAAGLRNPGVTIAARAFAPVIAPRAGEIAFAGPFRGHGMVVIIRHPARLTSVIAGLGELAVVPGQPVGRGALLGRAGGDPARIFFQMRRDGRPIDPLRVSEGEDR